MHIDNCVSNYINKNELKYGVALFRLGQAQNFEEIPITQNIVELIHDEMLHRYGGKYGINDSSLLEQICSAPYVKDSYGQDVYPSVFDKAAILLSNLVTGTPFVSGNKRTGLEAAFVYLELNGYDVTFTPTEAYNLINDVSNGKIYATSEIAIALANHVKIKESPLEIER